MESKADIEMRWVVAWSDLLEIVGDRRGVPCQLPDCSIVDVEECKGFLQSSVYQGYHVQVTAGYVGHKMGIVVSRSKP